MPTDVLGYITSKGLQPKRADKHNVHVACPFCNEPENKRGRLYINVDDGADIPGLLFCHLCGEKGSLRSLQRFYGDNPGTDRDPGADFYELQRAAAQYFHLNLAHHPEARQYYLDRGLTEATIKRHKLGWADGELVAHLKKNGASMDAIRAAGLVNSKGEEFYRDVYTIPYVVGGTTCVGIRSKIPDGKYIQPTGWAARLYNLDSIRGATEVVISEGEFDCLIAEQLGYAAVGVPGANIWQESWNTYFKETKRIWVVFDNDDAGRTGSQKVAESLGPRARPLTVPGQSAGATDDKNDLSDWVVEQKHSQQDFADLLRRNKKTLLITVDEAMAEWDEIRDVEGVKLGFERLDLLIRPGLLGGEVVIAGAKTNTGKTLWLLNTFEHIVQRNKDACILFLSLEQTRRDWFERAMRIRAFYLADEVFPAGYDPVQIRAYDDKIRQVTGDYWRGRFMMTDVNRMTEDEVREAIEDYQMEMGRKPTVVALDYLGYLSRSYRGESYERTSAAVMGIKAVAKDLRVPVLMPHQVNRGQKKGQKIEGDNMRDSGAVEETADFIFGLSRPDAEQSAEDIKHHIHDKTGMVCLNIDKSRHGGKDHVLYYQWGLHSLVMIPSDAEQAILSNASRENGFDAAYPWQHVIRQIVKGDKSPFQLPFHTP